MKSTRRSRLASGILVLALLVGLFSPILPPQITPTARGMGAPTGLIRMLEDLEETKALLGEVRLTAPDLESIHLAIERCLAHDVRRVPMPGKRKVVVRALKLLARYGERDDPGVVPLVGRIAERTAALEGDPALLASAMMTAGRIGVKLPAYRSPAAGAEERLGAQLVERLAELRHELERLEPEQRGPAIVREMESPVRGAAWAVGLSELACDLAAGDLALLDRFAAHDSPQVKSSLARALMHSGEKGVPILTRLLAESDWTIRHYAVRSLGVVGGAPCAQELERSRDVWFPRTPIRVLLKQLTDKQREKAEQRIPAAKRSEWLASSTVVFQGQADVRVWRSIDIALFRIRFRLLEGAERPAFLVKTIVHSRPVLRPQARHLAAKTHVHEVLSRLLQLAETETDIHRRAAIDTSLRCLLTRLMPTHQREEFARRRFHDVADLLGHSSWRVRSTGIDLMAHMEDRRAIPLLVSLLNDPFVWEWRNKGRLVKERTIVMDAVHALSQIGDPQAVEPLVALLTRPIESQSLVQKVVLKALRRIDDPRAAGMVKAQIAGLDPSVRAQAQRVVKWLERERNEDGGMGE